MGLKSVKVYAAIALVGYAFAFGVLAAVSPYARILAAGEHVESTLAVAALLCRGGRAYEVVSCIIVVVGLVGRGLSPHSLVLVLCEYCVVD